MKADVTITIACALFLALVTAVAADDPKPLDAEPRCEGVDFIGMAWMADDGKIGIHLRSVISGAIVESDLLYKPGDPDYDSIMKHLGGLSPGQSKSVKPWC